MSSLGVAICLLSTSGRGDRDLLLLLSISSISCTRCWTTPSLLSRPFPSRTSATGACGGWSELARAEGSLPSGIVSSSPIRRLFDSESSDLAESCPPAGSEKGSETVSSDILRVGGVRVPPVGGGVAGALACPMLLKGCPTPGLRPETPRSAWWGTAEGWTSREPGGPRPPEASPPSLGSPADTAEALSGCWAGLLHAWSGGMPSRSTSTAPVLWPCICFSRSLYCLDSMTCMAISSGCVAGRSWSVLHFHSLLLMATYTVCPFWRITSPGPTHLALSPPLAVRQTKTHCPAAQVRCLCKGGREASLIFSLLTCCTASFLACSRMLWLRLNSNAGVSISLGSQRMSSQPGVCRLASESSSAGSLGFLP